MTIEIFGHVCLLENPDTIPSFRPIMPLQVQRKLEDRGYLSSSILELTQQPPYGQVMGGHILNVQLPRLDISLESYPFNELRNTPLLFCSSNHLLLNNLSSSSQPTCSEQPSVEQHSLPLFSPRSLLLPSCSHSTVSSPPKLVLRSMRYDCSFIPYSRHLTSRY